MKIAVIGHGNVGGALAQGWSLAGHDVIVGLRQMPDERLAELQQKAPAIRSASIAEAAQQADVILIAATPTAVQSIAEQMGNVAGKLVIDAMNSVSSKPEGFANTFAALQHYLPQALLVKSFNSTGFENMAQPRWANAAADMFMAGDNENAKAIVRQLAIDLGFEECYDFGAAAKAELLEQFALAWINLAIFQKQGRDLVFKVIRRNR